MKETESSATEREVCCRKGCRREVGYRTEGMLSSNRVRLFYFFLVSWSTPGGDGGWGREDEDG